MNDESRRQFIQASLATAVLSATNQSAAGEHPGDERASSRTGDPPDEAVDSGPAHSSLIERIRSLLGALQSTALGPFLADWPVGNDRRAVVPTSLPVVRWLPEVKADAPAFSTRLVGELCRVAPTLAWRRTYKVTDVGATFLENYGWTEIVGLSGELASQRIACGFLLLGPETHYPRHRHEAEEIYIPLAGNASWQQGDGVWRERSPGTVIHHASDEPHAMRTGVRPLLALYLWRSANLNQKSRLEI